MSAAQQEADGDRRSSLRWRNAKLVDLRVAVDRLAGVLETHFRYEDRHPADRYAGCANIRFVR
jgi:hypothetical protein